MIDVVINEFDVAIAEADKEEKLVCMSVHAGGSIVQFWFADTRDISDLMYALAEAKEKLEQLEKASIMTVIKGGKDGKETEDASA